MWKRQRRLTLTHTQQTLTLHADTNLATDDGFGKGSPLNPPVGNSLAEK